MAAATLTCPKCDGSGSIPGYAHVAQGVCFCCGGSGVVRSTPARMRSAEQRQRAALLETLPAATRAGLSRSFRCGAPTAELGALLDGFYAGVVDGDTLAAALEQHEATAA